MKKSPLDLFREGNDYIQISDRLGISVPDVERKIHALRSAEKGDGSQQGWYEHLRMEEEHRIDMKRRRIARQSNRREPIAYVGKERGVQF